MIKRVISIEDNRLKHIDIKRALNKSGVQKIDLATNAEEAIKMIEEGIQEGKGYELLITCMEFQFNGKQEPEAGMLIIKELKKKNIEIPIVMCSSEKYHIPEIERCIFCEEGSERLDGDIRSVIRDLETKRMAEKIRNAHPTCNISELSDTEINVMFREGVRVELEKLRKMNISPVFYDSDKQVIYKQHSDGSRTEICKSQGIKQYINTIK